MGLSHIFILDNFSMMLNEHVMFFFLLFIHLILKLVLLIAFYKLNHCLQDCKIMNANLYK